MILSSSSWTTSWYIPAQWRYTLNTWGKVLEALCRHRLYAKASKCNIMEEEVEFLGQWITPQGAAPLKQKMRAVVEWEAPQDLKGGQIILGVCQLLSPLCTIDSIWIRVGIPTDLPYKERCSMGMGAPYNSTTEAFLKLKEALCNALLLQYPRPVQTIYGSNGDA